jgi:hypothetical protein
MTTGVGVELADQLVAHVLNGHTMRETATEYGCSLGAVQAAMRLSGWTAANYVVTEWHHPDGRQVVVRRVRKRRHQRKQ